MPTSNTQIDAGPGTAASGKESTPVSDYQLTFCESPNLFVSVFRSIRDWLREPKVTVPPEYYRGEIALPVTEMRAWYRDLPSQIKLTLEKPRDPVGIVNRQQEKRRALVAFAGAAVLGGAGWLIYRDAGLILGMLVGYVGGEVGGAFLYKKMEYPPDIWQDYRMQAGSWINSVLVHSVAIALLVLPYLISAMFQPAKASSKMEVTDISPYLNELAAMDKKSGGGGGGGDRSPTPASKGKVPKFAKTQLAPPMAVIPNPNPVLPVQPNLLGPPQLKLPEMAANAVWGDPQGVMGPLSNGPGTGGGIGSGTGTGIGSGKGGGLGPGEGGGTGGGYYSVGGNVSAPIPIYKPEPAYSEEARKAKYQGTVVLWIIVDAQGSVHDVRVVKPLGLGLDEKAVEAVKTWKFKPATRNGVPVPVRVMVEVSFRLF